MQNKYYNMKLGKISLLFLTLSILVFSCKKDDNIDDPIVVEARDRGEQQLADNDSLVKYLETHYYNSDAFIGNSDPSISDIIITDLEEDGYTLLKDAVETISIVYKGVDTSYDFYVHLLNHQSLHKIHHLHLNLQDMKAHHQHHDRSLTFAIIQT